MLRIFNMNTLETETFDSLAELAIVAAAMASGAALIDFLEAGEWLPLIELDVQFEAAQVRAAVLPHIAEVTA